MPRKPIRTVVVDDDPDVAESFSRLLQLMGCVAVHVTNPKLAINAAQKLEADVVFLDIGMPGLDGYELARLFRARYGDSPLHLVAVTAYGTPQDRAKSRVAGFDAHVQKPIDPAVAEAMIATLFRDL